MALGLISRLKLKQYHNEPLYRNSVVMIVGTGVTSLIGLLFWIVAVRLMPAKEIGLASAAIGTASLIVMLSRLGLDIGLVRYFPEAAKPSRLYNSIMNFTTGISVAGVMVFVTAIGIVSPALDILQQPAAFLVFLAYVVATSAFGLQNTTLIALRKTEYSLVQNILLGVRIPLLFLLVSFGMIGIFLAFEISYLATYLVGRHVLKTYGIRFEPRISVAEIKKLAGYSFGNYLCSLFAMAPATVIPLLIINVIGAEEGAYFFIAYSIASMLFMIPAAISMSLFVEGSHKAPMASAAIKSIMMSLVVLVPMVVFILLFGDSLLQLFSKEYAAQSADLLKLLSLSSIFNGIIAIFISVKKVEGDLRSINLVTLLLSLATIATSYLFMLFFGVTGLGFAWILSNAAVLVCVFIYWRPWATVW